ncbi:MULTISPECIES: PA14 domain-containing protein [unclassified Mucilaginibacter]|uniref:PA14 domain-containing protein n=1 Tax=unclassified Mucilaginibacter TaxID=2617802 RepID=UPI002AC9C62C|nr:MULTISPECIES: PA14 domain-containing protein [unclassified Mucilaginibacter]MEB0261139.1 PA14 domain-containing protein [Mucilaginibacter sp. 10I4]MEB0280514.1 PA14 domain-containing protein [Mucilaginibacter sp. 10B2]MEB0301280.1 PA14 domain-containing protein [Mucilaginibacter sp. 5C4]WPX22488.1 PA14 domain-containing protein [Mucilaginibacter sp. 5C4]
MKNLKCSGYAFLVPLISLFAVATSCNKDFSLKPDNATALNGKMVTEASFAAVASGAILHEQWDNVTGNDVSNIPVQTTPSSSGQVSTLEGAVNYGSNYGERFKGYIYPPIDGSYTFWIAGDDAAELWLSIDDNSANKIKIANTLSWTSYKEWTKFTSQKSPSIVLKANHKYYIEVLHKQGGGDGSVSVKCALPGNTTETSIPGSRFSPAPVTISGTVLREEWDNITGNDVANIPAQTTPTSSKQITTLEEQLINGSNYGERIRGYLNPPVNGNYTFWIAGDDAAELWLSTDDDTRHKIKIASTLSWTNFREWTKFPSQKSASVALKANGKYYIEVLHKQGGGGDNVSVQWMLPDNTMETPIAVSRLSTYVATAVTAPAYATSNPIYLDGAHDITISGKAISGGNVPAITLINCYNIHITQNKFYNSTDVGIHMLNCKNILVDYNYFTNVSSGVYAEQISGGGIVVNYNQFLNMQGPLPRGQFVQFNNVSGPNNSVSYNRGENIPRQSSTEDGISMYKSNGSAASPIIINGNWIRGGGPSSSSGGILLGDNGGSYLVASNNILVDPGEYGIGIAGGDHNSIINNTIYGRSQYFTNVAIYVNSIYGYTCTNPTVSGNKLKYYSQTTWENDTWVAPGIATPFGWSTNIFGANINDSVLPAVIITYN